MERSKLLEAPAAAADAKAPDVAAKPPADAPIASGWSVFERLVVPAGMTPKHTRALKHAFYAGARCAFASVIDSMQEIDAGDPNGDTRLASIESEVEGYFRDLIGQAFVSRTGRVET